MADVVLKNVCKVYSDNGFKAVEDFSLEIKDKEFIVLVGPSGCGKSTTLRMVAGLEDITEGTISIDGTIVNDVAPKDRDIAMVFQNYALYPHMTVFENMAFGLKLRGLPKKEIALRVKETAEILGISEMLNRRPKALSGGQRQRVAVGRAIVRKPKVFLFDEPLSNLDAKMRVQMRVEISKLHRRLGATMIYVTHDQTEAMTMGDRIVVLESGRVQQVADPMTLYNKPSNRFVAGFIGTPPMNFFEGKIVADDAGGFAFSNDAMNIRLPDEWKEKVAAVVNDNVTFGIRPEDISPAQDEKMSDMPEVDFNVEVVEPMGSETFVYSTVGSDSVIAKLGAWYRFNVGDRLKFKFFMPNAHIFDKSGVSLV